MNTRPDATPHAVKPSANGDFSARLLSVVSTLTDELHPGRALRVSLVSHLERDLGLDSLARVELLLRLGNEFGFSLPPDLRFRDGRSKWVLREVLGRYLPTELVDAPKAGFGLPIDTWLRSSLKDWAGDLLSPSNLRTHGLVPDRIVDGWKRHRSVVSRRGEV